MRIEGTIYAIKGDPDWCEAISDSLTKGEGRFGWSYVETADLRQLNQRIEKDGWGSLTDEEHNCYQYFLLDLKDGDYVVYVNVPEYGRCTVARVTGPYYWSFEDEDLNHRFPVDSTSVRTFSRNDAIVHPALSSRLKLPGRRWKIYLHDEFEMLVDSLDKGTPPAPRTAESNLRLLARDIEPFLKGITERIHHTHPSTALEELFAEVFRKMPGVRDGGVRWLGGAGDHGADILVTFEAGLPIPGLELEQTLVVQIKSFEGDHWDIRAVDDIQRAFKHYPEASMGLIISTASASTPALDEAIDKLRRDDKKPVALLIGPDVAAFVLRFGAKLLA